MRQRKGVDERAPARDEDEKGAVDFFFLFLPVQ